MTIVLGFGSTEKDFERQEFAFVDEFIKEKVKIVSFSEFCFSKNFYKDLCKALKARKEHYDKLDKEYHDSTEYPNRYSTYYFYVVYDVSDLCVIFKFHHINRRHALSPDGWALLQTKDIFHADIYDYMEVA